MYMDMTKLMDNEDRKYYVKNTIFKRNRGFTVIFTWPNYEKNLIPDNAVIYLTEKEMAFRNEFRDETKLVIPLKSITAIKRIIRPFVWGIDLVRHIVFHFNKKKVQKPIVISYKDEKNIEKNVLIITRILPPFSIIDQRDLEKLYELLKQKIPTAKVIEEK